ncbi:pilus assembly protein [Pseudomaricurvus alkylphenolicus]|uniref:pirin family protein n=1 Tax=Pseudomaricurvus alkylphenolicus TaxID=1306991 RepID=UPI00141E3493|nr:pirin family protein [Pseudomaricurvus alkylphenolicus]NIB40815.1 pilus assembly protein [Pseudomaricurvus alkylphenolicus]
MKILKRDTLKRGGFAGLRETRVVMDSRVFGKRANPGTWNGLDNFVYLADARFLPHGETKMHGHREVDVLSVMVEGRISHEGSLEHGKGLEGNDVQVQRAGGEGFEHNEVNPDGEENRMIQLWFMPQKKGESAGYRHYSPKQGELTRVYGGRNDDTFASSTKVDIALMNAGQTVEVTGEYMAYVTNGTVKIHGSEATDGDLIKGKNLVMEALSDSKIIVCSQ